MPTYITQLPLPSLPDGDFSTIIPLFRPTTSNSQQETTPLPPTYHSAPLNPLPLDPTAPASYHPGQFIHNHPTSTSTSNGGYMPTQPTYPNPDFTTLPAHHQYHHQHHHQHQYHHQPQHHPTHPTPSATARRWLTRINTIQQTELGASPPLAQMSLGTGSSPSSSDTTTTTTNSGPSSPTGGVGGNGGGGAGDGGEGHSRTSSGSGVAGVASPRQLPHQHQHQRRRVAKQRERERQSGDLDHRGLMGGFRVLWHR